MRILVTGCHGYIGSVLVPLFLEAGHEVVGLDSNWFEPCVYGEVAEYPHLAIDVRDVSLADLQGFDAVIHLAALSNDPMANLDPDLTYEINHLATVRLARLAKQAGVPRFLFSSSCSTYGASGDDFLTEEAALAGNAVRRLEGSQRSRPGAIGRRRLQPDLPAKCDGLRLLAAAAVWAGD